MMDFDLRCGIWNVEYGMRDFGYGTRDFRHRIWDEGVGICDDLFWDLGFGTWDDG